MPKARLFNEENISQKPAIEVFKKNLDMNIYHQKKLIE